MMFLCGNDIQIRVRIFFCLHMAVLEEAQVFQKT